MQSYVLCKSIFKMMVSLHLVLIMSRSSWAMEIESCIFLFFKNKNFSFEMCEEIKKFILSTITLEISLYTIFQSEMGLKSLKVFWKDDFAVKPRNFALTSLENFFNILDYSIISNKFFPVMSKKWIKLSMVHPFGPVHLSLEKKNRTLCTSFSDIGQATFLSSSFEKKKG